MFLFFQSNGCVDSILQLYQSHVYISLLHANHGHVKKSSQSTHMKRKTGEKCQRLDLTSDCKSDWDDFCVGPLPILVNLELRSPPKRNVGWWFQFQSFETSGIELYTKTHQIRV